ncbi:MAG: Molybdopterin molybdenumtransferase [Pelotomaculum sp. PtaB.Bin013]|uniref:Molybdopterin molybdenumtransferase n=1 Tax=Pelotomaculum isophthalicicum JI TaxID=947010 RepID=A0A9X4H4J9_9FIRM|nr:molybdopterin-binding protein [Pelotomaculum isophthalicicum]MDF9406839.1 molybdopterin-binding protein [Pelotomaculum isophthalicicum JI]OPX89659.1 MAG: Molybdopterin molybdenumtransferase [Pelotomaculum sp. PtaB.Bin013]
MLKVKVEEAVGMVLCHDITRIAPGEFKGPAFKKGHIVTEEDIPELLKLGKEHIFIWECGEDFLHEDVAALRIARAGSGQGVSFTEPNEGKVNLIAAFRGLLKINVEGVCLINDIEEVVLSTRHTNHIVDKGDILAGTRVIPLVINKEKIELAEQVCKDYGPLLEVKEMRSLRVGLITTGNEVFHGRIEDKFSPVIKEKLSRYGCPVLFHSVLPDETGQITERIRDFIGNGAEMIIITGGMSVDPDDVTPGGVRASGAEIVTYGAPILPGAMFLLAYLDNIPVLGLPACVMYFKTTIFDLILPRILAGERVARKEITRMGYGGLCLRCQDCMFPFCSFGKSL